MKIKLLLLLSCISIAASGMAPIDDSNLFPDLEEFSVFLYGPNELEDPVLLRSSQEQEPVAHQPAIEQLPQEQNALLPQQKGEKRENTEISSSDAEVVKKPRRVQRVFEDSEEYALFNAAQQSHKQLVVSDDESDEVEASLKLLVII